VDDDLEVVRYLGNTFTTLLQGYLVLTATTANQGLNFIKAEKPDVIVMDVRLGPASGMDLLEDYPKHIQGYKPHLIVITAYDDEKVKRRAEELKVDAYLPKPFSREMLLDAVLGSLENYHESHLQMIHFARRAFRDKGKRQDQADTKLKKEIQKNPPEKEGPNSTDSAQGGPPRTPEPPSAAGPEAG